MAIIKSLQQSEPQPSIDKVKIISLYIDPAAKRLQVQIGKGYEDGEFQINSVNEYVIFGIDYDDIMGTIGDSNIQICESLEEAVWQKLQAMNLVSLQ